MNALGYQIRAAKPEAAVALLKWNSELFPNSANACDSLAEMYEAVDNLPAALAASEQCLVVLPLGTYEQWLREALITSSKERIARIKAKQ